MTGGKALLSQLEEKAGPFVTFGDNSKGFKIGHCKKTSGVALKGARKGSLFVEDFDSTNKDGIRCFYTKELVRDMPKMELAQVEVCKVCQTKEMKKLLNKKIMAMEAHLIHLSLIAQPQGEKKDLQILEESSTWDYDIPRESVLELLVSQIQILLDGELTERVLVENVNFVFQRPRFFLPIHSHQSTLAQNVARASIPEKGTNYLAFTDANQAPDSFKGFVKLLSESYLAEFNDQDVNRALGLPTENLVEVPTPDELTEFMNFINYGGRINLSSLNRTNLRKEWSFIFDSVVRAFTCRKTGYDNISSVVQKLVYSNAHNRHRNVGQLILEELETRLVMPLTARGKEIFFPKFIMSTLNNKVADIHLLNGINSTKIGNCKQVSKIIFGSLTTKNKVNTSPKITPFMLERFRTYSYPMPDMKSNAQSSTAMNPEPVEVQTQDHQQGSSQAATILSQPL
ncbi:hypothetical protein AgCh_000928 [Apium graveolens]